MKGERNDRIHDMLVRVLIILGDAETKGVKGKSHPIQWGWGPRTGKGPAAVPPPAPWTAVFPWPAVPPPAPWTAVPPPAPWTMTTSPPAAPSPPAAAHDMDQDTTLLDDICSGHLVEDSGHLEEDSGHLDKDSGHLEDSGHRDDENSGHCDDENSGHCDWALEEVIPAVGQHGQKGPKGPKAGSTKGGSKKPQQIAELPPQRSRCRSRSRQRAGKAGEARAAEVPYINSNDAPARRIMLPRPKRRAADKGR